MNAVDLLIAAHRETGTLDKVLILMVILIALGVLIWMIRAILGSVINHDDRDL